MSRLVLVVLLCTSCTSWRTATVTTLNTTKAGVDAVHKVSAKVLHARCLAVAAKCRVLAVQCVPLKECQKTRASLDAMILKAYATLDLARIAFTAALTATGNAPWQSKAIRLAAQALAEYGRILKAAATLGVTP